VAFLFGLTIKECMILSKEQLEELKEVSQPLMKFLAKNFHPHVKVIVDSTDAEILEGSARVINDEFMK
jgi:hypothetical protein